MKSKWLLNLVLGVLAVALGAVAYYTPRDRERGAFALSTLAAREVTRIRIERAGTPAAVLESKGGHWRLAAPVAAPAESAQVERLLSILSAQSPQRMPPIELGRFDLDAPPLQVTFDAQVFQFGLVSPVTREQYVLTGGAVYAIAPLYAAGVPVDPLQLVRRRLFAEGAVAVRFTLPAASLARSDGGWLMKPARAELSQDDFNRFADAWRFATAARVARASARPALALIQIGFTDGETVAFDLVQREPELVLRRRDLDLEYTLGSASARRLLDPGDAAARG